MKSEKNDLALLYDIWQAAKDIVEYTEILSINSFAKDKMRRQAVERQIEADSKGPASFPVVDPDGNVILFDQHV